MPTFNQYIDSYMEYGHKPATQISNCFIGDCTYKGISRFFPLMDPLTAGLLRSAFHKKALEMSASSTLPAAAAYLNAIAGTPMDHIDVAAYTEACEMYQTVPEYEIVDFVFTHPRPNYAFNIVMTLAPLREIPAEVHSHFVLEKLTK